VTTYTGLFHPYIKGVRRSIPATQPVMFPWGGLRPCSWHLSYMQQIAEKPFLCSGKCGL
jgi:hypothetical protein